MESSKYEVLVRHLREGAYSTGTSKKDKYVLRRSAKKFIYDKDCNRLFFADEGQGGLSSIRIYEILLANPSVELFNN